MFNYIPDEDDLIWLSFNPQSGHEQAGRRPAVVLSSKEYNQRSGLLLCVPITNQIKGYPFEVELKSSAATGVALADQIKSLDWKARQAEYKGKASADEVAQIKTKIQILLQICTT